MNKLIFSFLLALAWTTIGVRADGETVYLAHNVWYENPASISTIGYKRGTIVPCGVEVTKVGVKKGARGGVSFHVPSLSLTLIFFIDAHQSKLLTPEDLKAHLFTNIPFEERTKDFSKLEILCIKKGYIAPGIRKDAVLMAYGYPPEHKTPSLDNPVWVYWSSRFASRTIAFDEEGLTTNGMGL